MTSRRLFVILLASLAFWLGCVGRPPEILRVFWQICLVDDQEQGTVYTELSLFIRPHDPDGIDDLDQIYLINDQEELFWKLESDSWQKSGSGGEVWIGTNGIRLPDGSPPPAGEYRVLLRDVGGDSVEQTLRLPSISMEEGARLFPKVSIRDREIRVSGKARSYLLWLYDRDGRFVAVRPMQGSRQPVQELLASYSALIGGFRFKVYAFFEREGLAVVSGPYAAE